MYVSKKKKKTTRAHCHMLAGCLLSFQSTAAKFGVCNFGTLQPFWRTHRRIDYMTKTSCLTGGAPTNLCVAAKICAYPAAYFATNTFKSSTPLLAAPQRRSVAPYGAFRAIVSVKHIFAFVFILHGFIAVVVICRYFIVVFVVCCLLFVLFCFGILSLLLLSYFVYIPCKCDCGAGARWWMWWMWWRCVCVCARKMFEKKAK